MTATNDPARPATLRVRRLKPAYRQVADELRTQIIAGALKAGDRLPTEPVLAQMFGVGRNTVREALRVLVSQHLIETTRGVQGGSFVASPEPDRLIEDLGGALGMMVMTPRLSVDNLLEARLLLEPEAARLAAIRADDEAAESVTRAAAAVQSDETSGRFAPHIDFHTTVLMASGNPMLALMLQPISEVLRTRLERTRVENQARWDHIDECHVDIAAAIRSGDGAVAERLMREHLERLLPLYRDIDTAN